MKNHTFKQYLEKEIYRAFNGLKGKDVVDVVEILEKIIIYFPLRKRFEKYPDDAMIRLVIFKELMGMSQTEVTRFLKENPEIALRLGFCNDINNKPMLPDQRSYWNFYNKTLDSDLRAVLQHAVEKIRELADKYSISLGGTVTPKKLEASSDYQLADKLDDKKWEVCKLSEEILGPSIKFLYLNDNSKHKMKKYVKAFVEMSQNAWSAEGYGETNKERFKNGKIQTNMPSGDAILYNIKKWDEDKKKMREAFTDMFDRKLRLIKAKTGLSRRGKINLAIDTTEIRYFGRKDVMVVGRGKKEPEGTRWCHKYIMLSTVAKGQSYVVLVLPVGVFTDELEAFKALLDFAKKRFDIGYIVADRFYSNEKYMDLIDKMGLNFIFRGKMLPHLKKTISHITKLPCAINGFKLFKASDFKVNILVTKGRTEKKIVYLTNVKIDTEADLDIFAERLGMIYSSRWRIETAFARIKKFLPRTTSPKHVVRYFYFLLSCCLYNLWVFARVILNIFKFGHYKENRIISEFLFLERVLQLLLPT